MRTYRKLNQADRVVNWFKNRLIKALEEKSSAERNFELNPDDEEAVLALRLAETKLASAEKWFAKADKTFHHLLCEVERNPPQPPVLALCCVVQA